MRATLTFRREPMHTPRRELCSHSGESCTHTQVRAMHTLRRESYTHSNESCAPAQLVYCIQTRHGQVSSLYTISCTHSELVRGHQGQGISHLSPVTLLSGLSSQSCAIEAIPTERRSPSPGILWEGPGSWGNHGPRVTCCSCHR